MKKVLVLGASGMLGAMVFDYFNKFTDHQVKGTVRNLSVPVPKSTSDQIIEFDVDRSAQLQDIVKGWTPDYIINCIGIIKPYCKDDDPIGVERAIRVNGLFPHYLAKVAEKYNIKVLRIATDCVYSGKEGKYNESSKHDPLDVYGKSMSLGEALSPNMLHIRCSVIGPELKGNLSLLEWFLSQPEGTELKGFTHHSWNGVTTLQFAKMCDEIISSDSDLFTKLRNTNAVHHYLYNSIVNKYELLKVFADVFERNLKIQPVNDIGEPVDRSLDTKYQILSKPMNLQPMDAAIKELKNYIDKELLK